MSLLLTAAQTVGPFVAIGFEKASVSDVAPAGVAGERVTITGRIVDGDGQPVTDAVIETWQANSYGKYAHPDDAANAADPVLNLVPAARRATLIAAKSADGVLQWNVHLQGPNETVFFDY